MTKITDSISNERGNRPATVKAVILDYGEVLCHRPGADEFGRMAKICGISLESFIAHWEQSRTAYDRGDLTPEAYWSKFAEAANTKLDPEEVERFCAWEIEMWTNVNPVMVEWLAKMNAAGIKTALLSNMPADLAAHVRSNFEWMSKFSFLTFSAEVNLVKPDPAIYQHVLRGLDSHPSETLFVDDRETNVNAARGLGIHAIQFQSVAQLKNDLEELSFPILPGID